MQRMSVPLLEQMGGEAVPQRVQRHALVDPGRSAASWNRRLSWRVVIGLPRCVPGKQPAFLSGVVASYASAYLPPLAQQFEHVSGDSMTWRSLRPLDCSIRMIFCALSIC